MLKKEKLKGNVAEKKKSAVYRHIMSMSFLLAMLLMSMLFLPMQTKSVTAASAVKKVTIKNGGINVTKKTLLMYAQTNTQLVIKVSPASAKSLVGYSSNNDMVADVDKTGKISAHKAGNAKITVTVYGRNGKKKSTYVRVKVKNKAVTNVILNRSQETIKVGESFMLLATISPSDATEQTVTWTSNKNSVAIVSSKGIVTGVSEGNAVITAKVGNKKAVCKFKVVDPSVTDIFAGGKGTEKSPYEIESMEQFVKISDYPDKYFKQIANISFNYGSVSPLFGEDNPFMGTYDANGYFISNYNYNDSTQENISIFGEIGRKGQVENLTVKDSFLMAKSGAMLVTDNAGQILNCKVLDSSVTVNVESYNHSDHFVGVLCAMNHGVIQNSMAEGTLVGVADGHASLSGGGIAGKNMGSIISCSSNSSLKITVKNIVNKDEGYSGGIAGINSGIISNCQADGSVYAYAYRKYDTYAGGISALNDGQVLNCLYLGAASNIVGEGSYGEGECNVGNIVGGGQGSVN